MDLSFLRNEIVIGLNKIFLGFKQFNFYPRYYVAINKKVLEQSKEEIDNLTCVKFLSDRLNESFENNALTNIIKSQFYTKNFSYDINEGVQEGYTVTYAALQIAFYLGFKEVYIIGMDHRFSYTGKPNEEKTLCSDDINHFTSDYFRNQKWDNPDLVNSETFYKIAKEIYENNGRTIIDSTVYGACQVFKKVDYREIFKGTSEC
jgi:hypothetical protein